MWQLKPNIHCFPSLTRYRISLVWHESCTVCILYRKCLNLKVPAERIPHKVSPIKGLPSSPAAESICEGVMTARTRLKLNVRSFAYHRRSLTARTCRIPIVQGNDRRLPAFPLQSCCETEPPLSTTALSSALTSPASWHSNDFFTQTGYGNWKEKMICLASMSHKLNKFNHTFCLWNAICQTNVFFSFWLSS